MDDTSGELAWYQTVVPDAIRRRYTAKSVVIVFVAMVAAAGVGGFFLVQTNDTLKQQVTADVTETATLQGEVLVNWIDGVKFQTRTLARSTTFQKESADAVQTALDEQTFRNDIRSVHFIDSGSSEIRATTEASSLRGVPFESLDAPWVSRLDSIAEQVTDGNSVYISDTPYTSVSGDDVIAFITSPPTRDDRLVIVEAAVTEQRVGLTGGNRTGYVTIHDPDSGVDEFVYDGSHEGKVVSSNLSKMLRSDAVSNEVIGRAPVQGTDWTVVAHVPRSKAFRLRNQIRTSLLALVMLPLVVIGLPVAVVGRRTGRTLRQLTEQAEQVRDGDLSVRFETARSDEIGRLALAFDDVRTSLKDRIDEAEGALEDAERARSEAETARKEAEQAREEATRINERLEQTADEYAAVMRRTSDGDLTQRMATDAENEAMARIAVAFNEMVDDIERTMGEIQTFAQQVAAATQQASTSSAEVKQTSEDISDSIQQIASGADRQREQLDRAAAEMNELSAAIEEAASSAETVAEVSEETATVSREGEKTSQEAIEQMAAIEETMKTAVDDVEELDTMMAEIDEIVDIIGDIAAQTNMLALNANIEAANAGSGDSGEGFAVVADEVKQLAEETQESAGEIANLIDDVQEQTETTVAEMQAAQERVEESTAAVGDAVAAFEQVTENVEETDAGVQEISEAMSDQATSAEQGVSMVDEVADQADRLQTRVSEFETAADGET